MCSPYLAILVSFSSVALAFNHFNLQTSPETFPKTPEKSAVLALEHTLAEVHLADDGTTLDTCRLYEIDSQEEEDKVMENLKLPKVKVSLTEMLYVIELCKVFATNSSLAEENNENSPSTESSSAEEDSKRSGRNETAEAAATRKPWTVWTGILPGTKWCGMGDIADSYEHLGSRRELDRCCRAHDHCPVKLKAFRAGWGLVNFSLYTKSHCDCDEKFFNCLKEADTRFSNILGNFYFNVMKVQCMKPERTMVCAEKIVPLDGKSQCIRWKYASKTLKMSFVEPEKTY